MIRQANPDWWQWLTNAFSFPILSVAAPGYIFIISQKFVIKTCCHILRLFRSRIPEKRARRRQAEFGTSL